MSLDPAAASRMKEDAINMVKSMLGEIPFNTLYSYADNLFDLKELPNNDPQLASQIAFLKKTSLQDISFEDINDPLLFTIRNNTTQESIQVSNRSCTRGELRGDLLRKLIEEQREIMSTQTAYECISSAIKNPTYSDMVTMIKGSFSGNTAQQNYGQVMDVKQLDLFIRTLLSAVNQKIAEQKLPFDLEPSSIRRDTELQKRVWEDIDVAQIYDRTELFIQTLQQPIQQLYEKISKLAENEPKAAEAVQKLHEELSQQANDYINQKIGTKQFSHNCIQLINEAQKGELKNHTSILASIFHSLSKVLNTLSFGVIAVTPKNSATEKETIEKVLEMKHALRKIVKDNAKTGQMNPSNTEENSISMSNRP